MKSFETFSTKPALLRISERTSPLASAAWHTGGVTIFADEGDGLKRAHDERLRRALGLVRRRALEERGPLRENLV